MTWHWCPDCMVKWWGDNICWCCDQPNGETGGFARPMTIDSYVATTFDVPVELIT